MMYIINLRTVRSNEGSQNGYFYDSFQISKFRKTFRLKIHYYEAFQERITK